MNPNPGQPYFSRQADHIVMYTTGSIDGAVDIKTAGTYRVNVWGKGTPLKGIFPIIALELDEKEIGRVEVKSDDWAAHSTTVTLPAGLHNLRVRFVNDENEGGADRNIWLDRFEFAKVD
jgi:hypothetical protein